MTLDDIHRSLFGGNLQNAKLRTDRFKKITAEDFQKRMSDTRPSWFNKSADYFSRNNDRLISQAEYFFLRSMLSLPPASVEIAFKMLDLDDNGMLEKSEFLRFLRYVTKVGTGETGPNTTEVESSLVSYLFSSENSISYGVFQKLVTDFRHCLLNKEYNRRAKNGKLSVRDFGRLIAQLTLGTADLSIKNKIEALNSDKSITQEEFFGFYDLVASANLLEDALSIYLTPKAGLSKEVLQRACKLVSNRATSEAVVDTMCHIFQSEEDGSISHRELIEALKKQSRIGQKPPDLGFERGVRAFLYCFKKQLETKSL
ncbi:uncharacterized protein LOC135143641 [Zophobas morio]|uniref:uncharacterized protein LOC135143641 n=1 Tax=Zophobas morio TaxID=2755281 RepID=UPI0030835683